MAESEGFDARAQARSEPAGGSPRQPLKKSRALAEFFRMSASGINKKAQIASHTCWFAFCFMPWFLTVRFKRKMAAENFIIPCHSETHFELKNSEFCCEMKFWKSLHSYKEKLRIRTKNKKYLHWMSAIQLAETFSRISAKSYVHYNPVYRRLLSTLVSKSIT